MKKVRLSLMAAAAVLVFAASSCNKSECHECHYDGPNGEVELGEKCDDELESLEANGYEENGTVYTVHCHEH
ncbi:hypothetical protein [Parvicella tangerina]|uniref:Uncharacterized protein n=1 Tax=Parvicella tangerina TaxID=2829795 RepID=A0A916JLS2_9FLAO|nr:hypothetical protein [Parvicella tangerina]CAG5080531.1 hypothetical protein CRYO30217_01360 [Parvicella tangerina]